MSGTLVYWVPDDGSRLTALKLTVCSKEDNGGVPSARRKRLSRIILEANSQGAKLSYRDLSLILLTSKATLKRDINYLKRHGLHPAERA